MSERPTRWAVATVIAAALTAACGGGLEGTTGTWAPTGDAAEVTTTLCPTVRAWADASVEAVNEFGRASPGLDPAERRTRYEQAFRDQVALDARLAVALDRLALPDRLRARLDLALADVSATVEEGAAEAAALPDAAYRFEAVSEGTLLTGTEKVKAIVFQALSELAGDPTTGIPAGAGVGRRWTSRRQRRSRRRRERLRPGSRTPASMRRQARRLQSDGGSFAD